MTAAHMTEEERLKNLEARIYNLNDCQASHTTMLAQHAIKIEALQRDVDTIRSSMATGYELRTGLASVQSALELAVLDMKGKVQIVINDLEPIKNGVKWLVYLVLASVVGAILALVVQKAKP